MATKYVRKSGSDSNGGTSPADAWLTVGKALGAAGISSGDTVYIGPGVYRAVLAVAMTSAVAETFVIGDPLGAFTGDTPGEVRITAYTTNDTTAPSASSLLDLAGRDHLTFDSITFQAGSSTWVSNSTGTATDIKFVRCCFLPGSNASVRLIDITATVDVALNWTFDTCRILLNTFPIRFTLPTSTIADYDVNVNYKSCVIISTGTNQAITVAASGANSFKGGGIKLDSIFGVGGGIGFLHTATSTLSTTIPCSLYNSIIIAGVGLAANVSGHIVEDNNIILSGTPRTNVTAGASSKSDGSYAMLVELGQSLINFGLCRPFAMPSSDSPLLTLGRHAGGPSTDIMGVTRSSAVGAYEFSSPPNRAASRVFAGF